MQTSVYSSHPNVSSSFCLCSCSVESLKIEHKCSHTHVILACTYFHSLYQVYTKQTQNAFEWHAFTTHNINGTKIKIQNSRLLQCICHLSTWCNCLCCRCCCCCCCCSKAFLILLSSLFFVVVCNIYLIASIIASKQSKIKENKREGE